MAEKDRFRTKQVLLRLSEEEYAILLQKAYEADLNTSDALRSLIVFGSVKQRTLSNESLKVMEEANANLKDCINAINRIGVNLNQIAYCTNVIGDANDEVVEEALLHTREIGQMLVDCYRELRDLCDANSSYS